MKTQQEDNGLTTPVFGSRSSESTPRELLPDDSSESVGHFSGVFSPQDSLCEPAYHGPSNIDPWFPLDRSGSQGSFGPPRATQNLVHRPRHSSQRSGPDGGSSRSFAPGLALRKAKVDPYDPKGLLNVTDKYTLLKNKQDAEVRGTWTTIDPDGHQPTFDRRWNARRSTAGTTEASLTSGSQTPNATTARQWSRSTTAEHAWSRPRLGSDDQVTSQQLSDDEIDERLEDPEIEVDPEIRRRFQPTSHILEERPSGRSAFEQRNRQIMPKLACAMVTKVVLGGKVAKTLERKGDTRGEEQDRFGRFIGANRGQMKKHLVDDRQALIKRRDEEMVLATQEKRAWDALSPDMKEQQLTKRHAAANAFARSVDTWECAVFEYAEIPEIYAGKATADEIRVWLMRSSRGVFESVGNDGFIRLEDNNSGEDMLSPTAQGSSERDAFRADSSTLQKSNQTAKAVYDDFASRRTESSLASPSLTSETTGSRASVSIARISEPRLVSATDILGLPKPGPNESLADRYNSVRLQCSSRGRVVTIALDKLVQFSPSNIVSRIFGGVLQDIQLHPRERMAVVIFIFPGEARTFIRHNQIVRRKDPLAYRQLQLEAQWYGGEEKTAVMPLQRGIYQLVLGERATRVLQLKRIPLSKKREELADELKKAFGPILVKVGLIRHPKRHVREKNGNSALIEFTSIKDAYEAFRSFNEGKVVGYEDGLVSWLRDPCDRPAPKSPFCICRGCAH